MLEVVVRASRRIKQLPRTRKSTLQPKVQFLSPPFAQSRRWKVRFRQKGIGAFLLHALPGGALYCKLARIRSAETLKPRPW